MEGLSWEALGLIATAVVLVIGAQGGMIRWLAGLLEKRLEERLAATDKAHDELKGRVNDLQRRHDDLRAELPEKYVTRDAVTQLITPLHWKIDALRKKLEHPHD